MGLALDETAKTLELACEPIGMERHMNVCDVKTVAASVLGLLIADVLAGS